MKATNAAMKLQRAVEGNGVDVVSGYSTEEIRDYLADLRDGAIGSASSDDVHAANAICRREGIA